MSRLKDLRKCPNCGGVKHIHSATCFLQCRECQTDLVDWRLAEEVSIHNLTKQDL